ncbi:MAG: hypothetical protein AB8B64_25545 [Granulosicoccus sp.]
MNTPKKHIVMALFAITALIGLTQSVSAKTYDPIALIIDDGYTVDLGSSQSTFLFVDHIERGSEKKFWVRVENNPGASSSPEQLPTTISIKYFPLSRYSEVRRSLGDISTFGLVNPYVEDFIVCDQPNTFIRSRRESITIAYNCGADAPAADAATFKSEALLKALRDETLANPDMIMSSPTVPVCNDTPSAICVEDKLPTMPAPDTMCTEGSGPICNDNF